MREVLITPDGKFNRSAIMRRAHARRQFWLAHGIAKAWSECLRDAWAAARQARADAAVIAKARASYHAPARRREKTWAESSAFHSRAAAAQMEART